MLVMGMERNSKGEIGKIFLSCALPFSVLLWLEKQLNGMQAR